MYTALQPAARARELARARKEAETLDREIARLTEAIATGGPLTSLLTSLRARQDRRAAVAATVTGHEMIPAIKLTRQALERQTHARVAAWRASLNGPVPEARKALRTVLRTPLWLTATMDGYDFEGELVVDRLLVGELSDPN